MSENSPVSWIQGPKWNRRAHAEYSGGALVQKRLEPSYCRDTSARASVTYYHICEPHTIQLSCLAPQKQVESHEGTSSSGCLGAVRESPPPHGSSQATRSYIKRQNAKRSGSRLVTRCPQCATPRLKPRKGLLSTTTGMPTSSEASLRPTMEDTESPETDVDHQHQDHETCGSWVQMGGSGYETRHVEARTRIPTAGGRFCGTVPRL